MAAPRGLNRAPRSSEPFGEDSGPPLEIARTPWRRCGKGRAGYGCRPRRRGGAHPMEAQKFEVGDAIRFGWETTKANLNLVVILTLVAAVATGIPFAIAEGFGPGGPVLATLFRPIGAIVSLVVSVGAIRISLRLHDGGSASVRDLFAVDGPLFWRYLWASILYSLIVAVGLVLLIIPGVILS